MHLTGDGSCLLQAVRNSFDLNAMSVPLKYREIGDFHEYYSGKRKAPYLTLFIGGNHEASNHLSELFYGGWAAPNIYYMGAANVLRLGPLRIAGLSGIWKGYSYNKPHHERLPYNKDDVKSVYHVREIDTRKLLCLRYQVDVGLSHDWPRGVEWMGDWKQLFRIKNHFEADARNGSLGSVAAKLVMDRLRPYHWFSAHLHCKYSAVVRHTPRAAIETAHSKPRNEDEIDVTMEDSESEAEEKRAPLATEQKASSAESASSVPKSLKDQLPASFRQADKAEPVSKAPVPEAIKNTTTRFLALDKCLPKRSFLQLLEISGEGDWQDAEQRPYQLSYDKEWLAITRAFASEIHAATSSKHVPQDKGPSHYYSAIDNEVKWVEKNVAAKGLMPVPENFKETAPQYQDVVSIRTNEQPKSYLNPQTRTFCELLQIKQPFS